MKKPLVYVAGPFTGKDPTRVLQNIKKACLVGQEIWELGFAIMVPHWNHTHELVVPEQSYEFYMEVDDQILQRCDALFRMSGESGGSDREVRRAIELGIPVFHNYQDLISWGQARAA